MTRTHAGRLRVSSPEGRARPILLISVLVGLIGVGLTACQDADANLLQRGDALTQQFYSGDFAPILADFTPQVADAVGGEPGLRTLQAQFTNQLGSEVAVVDEQISSSGDQALYQRVARYEKGASEVVLTWAFADDGRVAGFLIQPRAPTEPAPSSHLEYQTRARLRLPFADEFTVAWGGRTLEQNYHAAFSDQRFAYDLRIVREDTSFAGDGRQNEDYWCFGRPILTPGDGTIVTALDGIVDNVPGELNSAEPPGNHVIIDHGQDEFSVLAHLRQHSVRVAAGESVTVGDTLGECGNSGRSSEPHLHYHLQNSPLFGRGEGLPAQFVDYLADGEPVARGEPVRGERLRNRP